MFKEIKLWFRKDGQFHANKRFNEYDLSEEFGIGYTRKGEIFYFDLEDYEKIKPHCWHVGGRGRLVARNSAGGTEIKFHRLVMDFPDHPLEIDHIDRNQLNNRKENLRICSRKENGRNIGISKNNTSGVTGVHHRKDTGRYAPKIEVEGVAIRLGNYLDIDDAIRARLQAEKKYFGEFAPQKHLFEKYGIE